jgi:tagatose 1,6-diphosphate aldolase
MIELSPGKLWGLRRMADGGGRFKMVAVDQRPPIKNPIREKRGTAEAPYEDVAGFKLMLIEELQADASAILLDPHFALPRAIAVLSPAKGLIVTLEDSIFAETGGGRTSSEIDDWSVEKIKRAGGDAVKVLAWYRPDAAPAVCEAQKDFAARVGEACARYDIPYVFELLVYPLPGEANGTTEYVEMAGKRADLVLESVRAFAEPRYGVDLFKVESPVPARDIGPQASREVQDLFDEMGRLCGRPWVMLSAGAGTEEFRAVLRCAYKAGASGYLAGRAIWAGPFKAFPDWEAIRAGLREKSRPYVESLNRLTDEAATPWFSHPRFRDGVGVPNPDGSFRRFYAGFPPAAAHSLPPKPTVAGESF